MAFVKAYMETFNSESFVLIIEEPEAHLHPIAQRWLKKYIYQMCQSGIQVVISTHSPEFIDANNLEGLVKVYKNNGITQIQQLSAKKLCQFCLETGAPADKVSERTILDYYSACLSFEQLKGFFAQKIILVEGDTEALSLPYYFERLDYNLEANGIEIVKCQGKNNILKYYRLFRAYGYQCYCLLDADEGSKKDKKNDEFVAIFNIKNIDSDVKAFNCDREYGCFGVDFETYMRNTIEKYTSWETAVRSFLSTPSKSIVAKCIAHKYYCKPDFISKIISSISDK